VTADPLNNGEMMKQIKTLGAFAIVVILTGFALSTPITAANKKTSDTKKPTKMTCEDFLGFDEVARPKLVYWANGYNWWGNQYDPYVDIEETDSLVPFLVQECTKTPKTAFLGKVKEASKKKSAE
jgi:hypothetical protein